MIPSLDVFRVDGGKEPEWLGATESVAQALELARKSGIGNYMVFFHQTGHKTMYVVDAQGTVRQTS